MHTEDDRLFYLQFGFPILSSSGGAQTETKAQEEPDVDQVCYRATQMVNF